MASFSEWNIRRYPCNIFLPMQRRQETISAIHEGIFADQFRRGPAYTNWRPRGTPDWLLIYTEDGSGHYTTAAGQLHTLPGDVTLYAPGEMHDYRTAGRNWHLLWAHFMPRPHWQPWLKWPASHGLRMLRLPKGEVRDQFREAMLRAARMMRRKLPGALDLAFNALEEALIWTSVAASQDPWLSMDPRVRKAIDHLAAHSAEPFHLTSLARLCGASVSRFSWLFKRETGISPGAYLERQRMLHASRLLRLTSLGIAEIAAETGFADPFYFTNRFRRFCGMSPTNFRKKKAR